MTFGGLSSLHHMNTNSRHVCKRKHGSFPKLGLLGEISPCMLFWRQQSNCVPRPAVREGDGAMQASSESRWPGKQLHGTRGSLRLGKTPGELNKGNDAPSPAGPARNYNNDDTSRGISRSPDVLLTRKIKSCQSWRELQDLYMDMGDQYNEIHISATIVALKR